MELLVEIKKYVSKDGHDIEFIPADGKPGVTEVWVDGVFIENLAVGVKSCKTQALYYYEVHCTALEEALTDNTGIFETVPEDESNGNRHDVIAVVHAATQ